MFIKHCHFRNNTETEANQFAPKQNPRNWNLDHSLTPSRETKPNLIHPKILKQSHKFQNPSKTGKKYSFTFKVASYIYIYCSKKLKSAKN
jgi:hypothetical protein